MIPSSQVECDRSLDASSRFPFTEMIKQQSYRQHRRSRIGDALTGNIRGAAMYWFEHAWVTASHIQIAASGKANTPGDGSGQVGQDVAKQVVRDDHIKPSRVGHHVNGGRVHMLISHHDIGVLQGYFLHNPRPQGT